jgi:hypothetical protein
MVGPAGAFVRGTKVCGRLTRLGRVRCAWGARGAYCRIEENEGRLRPSSTAPRC